MSTFFSITSPCTKQYSKWQMSMDEWMKLCKTIPTLDTFSLQPHLVGFFRHPFPSPFTMSVVGEFSKLFTSDSKISDAAEP